MYEKNIFYLVRTQKIYRIQKIQSIGRILKNPLKADLEIGHVEEEIIQLCLVLVYLVCYSSRLVPEWECIWTLSPTACNKIKQNQLQRNQILFVFFSNHILDLSWVKSYEGQSTRDTIQAIDTSRKYSAYQQFYGGRFESILNNSINNKWNVTRN